MKLTVYGQTITAHYVDTGAPHVVVNINDILRTPNDPDSRFRDIVNFPVETIGREIRFHQTFYPTGTNVNFFLLQNGTNFIRTFERGVEAETYACGTGSVATAVILALIYGKTPPVRLVPKSQKILEVNFIRNGDIIRDVSLTGPAEINYRGEFELSAK
jgi:diaminopimelate epimerase